MTGEAKITHGYRLPCKYVIHTAGPIWQDGHHGERELLTACYRNSLELADKYHCESVAFPLISSGVYGYPKAQALKVAMDTITQFLLDHDMTVYIVVFSKDAFEVSNKLFKDIEAYIDDVYVDERLSAPSESMRMRLQRRYLEKAKATEAEPEECCAPSMASDARLDDMLSQVDESFAQMLIRKIDERHMTDAQCYKRANMDRRLFNKIKIQADYFYEKREGIFIQRESTPSVVGTKTAQWVNLGRMKNQGFDMSLEFDHSFNKDFSISARGNFTYNRNKKLYDDKPDQIWKYQNLAGFANNQQFGLIAEGLFESEEDIANWPKQDFGTVRPGDIKYRDVNGDGVVNTFDKVAIGYTLVPEINYGFGASLKWKGIDVSVFFSGVGHVTRIIQGQNLFGASSTILRMGQIFEDVAKNRWTLDNQNPNAPYPRLSLNKVDNNQQLSTYWQRDMSFLRLKDAEIGYTLPESMTKKWGLSKIRFYIQGKNLVTFSDFKLWDPEVNANYGNVYPLIRTFAIGANVNF